MGFWSRLVSAFRQKATPDDWFSEFGWGGRTNSGVAVNQTTAMQVATVMACVRVCSEDVAKLPARVFRRKQDGGRVEATDHFLHRLLKKPNTWQTWFEFCEMMQVALRMRGNAYAAVIRDGRATPVAMIAINPNHVTVYQAEDGSVFYSVSRTGMHERAMLKGFPLMIPAGDIFHLRWASADGLIGLSPISYARETIGLALGMEMHAANLIGAGARPSGVLQTDKKLTKEVADRLRASWQDLHGGPASSGKTAVLEEGLKWEALTMTSVDLEFIAGRRLQAELICQIFRVAPFKVGITQGVSAKNIEQVQLQHYTDTIHPDLVRWEQKFRVYFDLADDIFVEFDTGELIRADLAARSAAARILTMSAITTPDEQRINFGLDPMGGAAEGLFIPANMLPIDKAGEMPAVGPKPGPGSDTTGAPADGGDGDPAELPDG